MRVSGPPAPASRKMYFSSTTATPQCLPGFSSIITKPAERYSRAAQVIRQARTSLLLRLSQMRPPLALLPVADRLDKLGVLICKLYVSFDNLYVPHQKLPWIVDFLVLQGVLLDEVAPRLDFLAPVTRSVCGCPVNRPACGFASSPPVSLRCGAAAPHPGGIPPGRALRRLLGLTQGAYRRRARRPTSG